MAGTRVRRDHPGMGESTRFLLRGGLLACLLIGMVVAAKNCAEGGGGHDPGLRPFTAAELAERRSEALERRLGQCEEDLDRAKSQIRSLEGRAEW